MDEVMHVEEISKYKTSLFLSEEEIKDGLKIEFTVGSTSKTVVIPKDALVKSDSEDTSPIFLKLVFLKNEVGKILTTSLNLHKNNVLDKALYD